MRVRSRVRGCGNLSIVSPSSCSLLVFVCSSSFTVASSPGSRCVFLVLASFLASLSPSFLHLFSLVPPSFLPFPRPLPFPPPTSQTLADTQLTPSNFFQAVEHLATIRPALASRLPTVPAVHKDADKPICTLDITPAKEILGLTQLKDWKTTLEETIDSLIEIEKQF